MRRHPQADLFEYAMLGEVSQFIAGPVALGFFLQACAPFFATDFRCATTDGKEHSQAGNHGECLDNSIHSI